LGHILTAEGVAVDPEKVTVVANWKRPTYITEVTLEGSEIRLDKSCERSFNELKKSLTTAPVLALPDTRKDFTMYYDASR
jgi:hypothetical protein